MDGILKKCKIICLIHNPQARQFILKNIHPFISFYHDVYCATFQSIPSSNPTWLIKLKFCYAVFLLILICINEHWDEKSLKETEMGYT